jgi:hypothetical protein
VHRFVRLCPFGVGYDRQLSGTAFPQGRGVVGGQDDAERGPAFQFVRDVPVEWDDTAYIEAEPGDYLTAARRAKGKDEWYIGAITDENARTAVVPLTFLKKGRKYIATIYADGPNAHWRENPYVYKIEREIVDSRSTLRLMLASGGGAAFSIKPVSGTQQNK